MRSTPVRLGEPATAGVSRRPSEAALALNLRAAIAAALREPPDRTYPAGEATVRLPRLRIALPAGATEADIARAVAHALREAMSEPR
jgi:hypothetical protein